MVESCYDVGHPQREEVGIVGGLHLDQQGGVIADGYGSPEGECFGEIGVVACQTETPPDPVGGI